MNPEILRPRLLGACVLSTFVLAGFATYYMLWSLVLPYPIHGVEYIESSVTRLLLEGKNPYMMEVCPTYLYVYGIFYHMLAYPFAAIFGPTLVVMRAMADFGVILAGVTLYWGMRLTRVPPLIALLGALLFYAHLAYYDVTGPNSLGDAFLLLALVIPLALDFRWSGILVSLFLALLAFFTKHYCILSAPVLLLYLFLFRSKALGLAAGVIFFSGLAAFIAWLNAVYPLFLTNVFYENVNYTAAYTSYGHLLRVMAMYFPMGIGLVVLLGWWTWKVWTGSDSPLKASWKWNFLDLRQPLILAPALRWVDYLVLIFGILYLLKMGPHAGSSFSYIFELVTPFLLWRCCIVIGVEAPHSLVPPACFLATVLLVGASLAAPMFLYSQIDHRAEWRRAAGIVSQFKNVLAPGALDGILLDQRKDIYDGGMTDLYVFAFAHNPCPIALVYKQRCDEFFSTLQQQVREQRFDAIFLYAEPSAVQPLVPRDLVAQYYIKLGDLPLPMSLETYRVEVWVPRKPDALPASGT